MGESTAIEWTDHTFNPWWGCTKVSPGCDHCYAEAWDKRTGGGHWGSHADRRTFGISTGASRCAGIARRRRPEFGAGSFAHPWLTCSTRPRPTALLIRLCQVIRTTRRLDWQMLTKRPQNLRKMLPPDWGHGLRERLARHHGRKCFPRLMAPDYWALWNGLCAALGAGSVASAIEQGEV